jgi:hypothetical protein
MVEACCLWGWLPGRPICKVFRPDHLSHGRSPHGAITLGAALTHPGIGRFSFTETIQHYAEYQLQVVTHLKLEAETLGSADLRRSDLDPRSTSAKHVLRTGAAEKEVPLAFAGVLPVLDPASAPEPLAAIAKLLSEVLAQPLVVEHLGPFRAGPLREYRLPGTSPRGADPTGIDAPAVLASDALRGKRELVEAVGDWYAQHLGGFRLDVEPKGIGYFQLVLRAKGANGQDLDVNLVDVGTGIAQVLPIVVRHKLRELSGASAEGMASPLEIVEQPELHLHPAAHGAVADLCLDAAASGAGQFLVETHSETFVLRLRRRIAERMRAGMPSQDLVRLYFVADGGPDGHKLREIEISPDGDVNWWPTGVFSEDFDEVKNLRQAQRGH